MVKFILDGLICVNETIGCLAAGHPFVLSRTEEYRSSHSSERPYYDDEEFQLIGWSLHSTSTTKLIWLSPLEVIV